MDDPIEEKLDQNLSPAIKTDAAFGKTLESFALRYRSYPASLFTVLVGLLVIVGWAFEITLFKSLMPGFATMKVNTALGFILSGISLLFLQPEPQSRRYILISKTTALIVLAIGLLNLCQYLFGWDLGIDQFLLKESYAAQPIFPGRMSPITAFNFSLIGGSLLFLKKKSHNVSHPAQWVAVIVVLISLLAIIGYAYDVQSLYKINPFTSFALHTAFCFFILSIGIFFTQPRRSIVSMILEDNAGGVLLRTLLPAALICPFVLGWIGLVGLKAGYYSTEFGLAVFAVSNIVIFVTLTVVIAKIWGKFEVKRKMAESALSEKEAQLYAADRQLADIFYGMSEAFFVLDFNWHYKFVNDRAETFLKFKREEILGKSIWEVYGNLVGTPVEEQYRRVMGERVPVSFEVFSIKLERWLDVRLFPTGDGLAGFLLDIHDRKMIDAERQKFVSLAENSTEFVGMSNLQGEPLFINQAGWKLVGLDSLEEAFQKKMEDYLFPEDREFIFKEFLPKIQLNGSSEVEIRFRHFKTGEAIWLLCNGFLLRDEKKETVGFATVSRDITERKHVEEELRGEKDRLKKIAIATPSAIYTYRMSPEGNVSLPFSSPVIEELFGFTPEELKNDCSMIFDNMHPDDVERVRESISESARNLRILHETIRYRHPQKGAIWIEAYSAPKTETDGSIVLHGVANDVTERKQIEEQIVESEKRYRLMFESNPMPMWVYDLETLKFLAVNDAAIRHYGYKREEFLSMTLRDLRLPEDIPAMLAGVAASKSKIGSPAIRRHLKKDGTLIDVEVISHGLLFGGRLARLVLANDITERKRAEGIILELNATLEKKVAERTTELLAVNKELEAFSYSVSHDLRAPLRAMDGFSLALLEDYEDKLDEDGKNYLQRVRSGSQNMARLIDDLLELSQMSRGELQRENVNLSKIVSEITDGLQEFEPKSAVSLKIESDVWAFADERLMRAALENLLNNAWKFTSKKENAEILFGQKTENGETIYFVSDNGAGFDMTYSGKLFGAFQRFDFAQFG